jgi:hypothetical protein
MTKREWVDGSTDFTDFHGIFTDWESNIRKNPVKIREIRISINPIPFFCHVLRKSLNEIKNFLHF